MLLAILKIGFFCLLSTLNQAHTRKADLEYLNLIHNALDLYHEGRYQLSGEQFNRAFEVAPNVISTDDRYNAACSWALAGNKNQAFGQLFILTENYHYDNMQDLLDNVDLYSLRSDSRWEPFLDKVKANGDAVRSKTNTMLKEELDTIFNRDQTDRGMVKPIVDQFGAKAPELKRLWKKIYSADSSNKIAIDRILKQYGWPEPADVGYVGSSAVFLVIQHSDVKSMKTFLPRLQEAVKANKTSRRNLALMEDRVALAEGNFQSFGTQLQRNEQTGKYFVMPLLDPEKVDYRRANLGLSSLKYELKRWSIDWDPCLYIDDLPNMIKRLGE